MFLLDTNTLIYFFKGQGKVAERLFAVPPGEVAISSVSLYEIEVGIAKSANAVFTASVGQDARGCLEGV